MIWYSAEMQVLRNQHYHDYGVKPELWHQFHTFFYNQCFTITENRMTEVKSIERESLISYEMVFGRHAGADKSTLSIRSLV